MDHGMQVVGELRRLTALDLSMVFNATGAGLIPASLTPCHAIWEKTCRLRTFVP